MDATLRFTVRGCFQAPPRAHSASGARLPMLVITIHLPGYEATTTSKTAMWVLQVATV